MHNLFKSLKVLCAVGLISPAAWAYDVPSSPGGGIDPGAPPPPPAVVGQLAFSAGSFSVAEDAGSLTIAVTRGGGSAGAVSVDYATVDGSARAGSDYTAAMGAITWQDGESGAKFITVTILDDTRMEDDKNFEVRLSNFSDPATVGLSSATVTVTNDDARNPRDLLGVAQNPTQLAMAENIVGVLEQGEPSAELRATLEDLTDNVYTNPDQVSHALQRIAPEEYLVQRHLAMTNFSTQQRHIDTRLYTLRLGIRCTGGDSEEAPKIRPGTSFFAPASPCPDGETTDTAGRWSGFVNGDFSGGGRERTLRESGFNVTREGITAGVDYRPTRYSVVGAALSLADIDSRLAESEGDIDGTAYSLSLFGTLYRTDKFYLDGIVGFGSTSFDNERDLSYRLDGTGTAVNQTATADNDSTQYWFSLTAGAHYGLEDILIFSPLAAVDYYHAEFDGFDESLSRPDAPGGALAMHIEGYDAESTRLRVGARLSRIMYTAKSIVVPHIGLQTVYENNGDRATLSGWFLHDGAKTRFSIDSHEADSYYTLLDLGITGEVDNWMVYALYEHLLGMDYTASGAMSVGVRRLF